MLVWEDWHLGFADILSLDTRNRGERRNTYIGTYEAVYKGKGHNKEIIWANIKKLSGKCIYDHVPEELSEVRYKFHWARLT